MRWFKSALLAIVLAGVPMAATAQTMTIQRICAPSYVAVAVLHNNGLKVVDAWVDDDGWPVELWADGYTGRAVVALAQADDGSLLRCLIFAASPPGEKS